MEARPAGRLDEDFAGRKARVAGTEDEDRRDLTAGRGSTSEELLPGCKARFTEVEDGDFAGCKARVAGVGDPFANGGLRVNGSGGGAGSWGSDMV